MNTIFDNQQKMKDYTLYVSYVIFGFVCHGFAMCNHMPQFSGITQYSAMYSIQIAEGRWLGVLLMMLNGDITAPWLTGMEGIFLIAASSLLVCKIYKVQKWLFAIAIGFAIISSPALCNGTFDFLYMGEVFAGALFLASLSVFFLFDEKKAIWKRYAMYVSLLTLSMGAYQVYVGYAIMLIVIYEVRELLRGSRIDKTVKDSVIFALLSVLSMILYSLISKVVCFILNVKATNVMVYPKDVINMLRQIKKCYISFIGFIWNGNVYSHFIPRIIIIVEAVIILVLVLDTLKMESNIVRTLVCAGILCLMPIVCFFIHLTDMGKMYDAYRMCAPSIVLFFMLCVFWDGREPTNKLISTTIVVLTLSLSWYQMSVDNLEYMKSYVTYENDYSMAIRLVDRVESDPEYKVGTPVYVYVCSNPEMEDTDKFSSIFNESLPLISTGETNNLVSEVSIQFFINQFIQPNMNIRNGRGVQEIENIIDSMPMFPEKESIMKVDDFYVVKIEG